MADRIMARLWIGLIALIGMVSVVIAEPAPRIVSLSPALTETLYALELDQQLVGRSQYCDYPPQVGGLPEVGSALTPNFEAIARLGPTVIVTAAGDNYHQRELLKLAEVVALPWLTVEEVIAGVRALGQRFAREARAHRLVQRLSGLLQPPPLDGPRVLLLLGGPLDGAAMWFIRRNSLHGAALHAAGYRNAVAADIHGAPTLGIEALLQLNPDAIVVLAGDLDDQAQQSLLASFDRLAVLNAVAHDRVAVLPGSGHLRSGPGVVDFSISLRDCLGALWRVPPQPSNACTF